MHAALYVLALVVAAPHAAAFLPRADDGPVHLTLHNTEPRQRGIEADNSAVLRRFGLHRRQGDSLDASLTNHFQQRYSVKVAIGPGLWVYDSGCTPEVCASHSGGFDASTSSSYTLNNRTGLRPGVQFINSYCHGLWGWDTVGIGSSKVPQASPQSAEAYPFCMCPPGIYEPPGVIGFSWPIPNYPDPLWTFLVKDWKDKRFGVYLAHQNETDLVPADPNGGVLTLGGVNNALFTGEINYVPNVAFLGPNHTFWAVMVDSATVGSSTSAQSTLAIVDTGSPLSGVPPAVYRAVYAGVTGMVLFSQQAGINIFPCESAGSVSPLDITLGGVKYTIPAKDLYRTYGTSTSSRLPPGFTPGPSGQICGTQLQLLDPLKHGYDWMFGDVILRNLYQVYQYDPLAIGFARVADGAQAAVAAGATGSSTPTTSAGVGVGGAAGTGFGVDTTQAASNTAAPTATRLPSSARPLLTGASAVLFGVAASLLA
ncbi:Gastricsin [Vanrija pseudolonga]|uniref:Gastricsin n=1 Tax=Vanrija pseudolonga TaxID=143232 RepID=A0AAF0YEN0_9TREE|nr:Gastricsin [Vanrija pseudolonga]